MFEKKYSLFFKFLNMKYYTNIIMENCFENLDAPVIRVGSLDTPIPFEETLEKQYLPFERFESEILKLIDY